MTVSFSNGVSLGNIVTTKTDVVTGEIEGLSAGTVANAVIATKKMNILNDVEDARGDENYMSVYSEDLYDWAQQPALPTLTDCTAFVDTSITRWGNATLAVTPSDNNTSIRKTSLSLSLDPVHQLAEFDVYLPNVVSGSSSIFCTLYNANYSANYTTWTWGLNALRQGWNTLKMWCGDTTAPATSPPTGTLGFGCAKVVGGTGFNPASPITHLEINTEYLSGVQINFAGFRKGGKAKTCLVMGFDSTGYNAADDVFTKTGGVAEFLASKGIKGYFTSTALWDLFSDSTADQARKEILYRTYLWDCLPHCWNHGASLPGATFTATSAVRSSNVVTFTANASLATTAGTAMPNGKKFYAMVSGATPSDYNGLQLLTVTGTTTATYTAAGVDGTATGTVLAKTTLADVIATNDATTRAILRHELVDLVRLLRARGWSRGSNIGAQPNNSVPLLSVLQTICAEAGIKYFRAIKKTTTSVTEFGVDNPLHFGSTELGNGSGVPTLAGTIAALTGAIGRGEHLWLYGHYILDETDPANIAHVNADLNYTPGNGGNPAAPSANGWWYMGNLKKFINDTVMPLVAAGTITVKSPTEWAASLGNIDEST